MKGFFSSDQITQRKHIPLLPQCGQCGLYKTCLSPKMEVYGRGRKKILIAGEAPGKSEDLQGRPFVGKSGEFLRDHLERNGIRMDSDCWITNGAICRPPGNNLPPKAIEYCRPNIIQVIKEKQPEKILLLGGEAVNSVIGWLWKEDVGPIGRWIGWQIPCQRLNAWICPLWHPAFVLRNDYGESGRDRGVGNEVREAIFSDHLEAFSKIEGRPWDTVPQYGKEVRILMSDTDAACFIETFQKSGRAVAFDFETNILKPDSDEARIVCCSLSNGEVTIAYPWYGKAIEASWELFRSGVPLISHNSKFEMRWVKKEFGFWPKNIAWDTMIAAHVLDNRKATKSLKFQSWVHLGQEDYDSSIKPFLKADHSNATNRIKEANLQEILRYCGIDSLVTYHLAQIQSEKLGIELE